MPLPPTTRRIPKREWDNHQHRIIELYLDDGRKLLGPDGVVETMEKEGFTATKSQYEAQFREWDIRKNMKSDDWRRIIRDRQQGNEMPPIILSDRAISASRIHRAQRRYAPEKRRPQKGASSHHDHYIRATSVAFSDEEAASEAATAPVTGPAHELVDLPDHGNFTDLNLNADMSFLESSHETIDISNLPALDAFSFDAIAPQTEPVSSNPNTRASDDSDIGMSMVLSNDFRSMDLSFLNLSPGWLSEVTETRQHQPSTLGPYEATSSLDTSALGHTHDESPLIPLPSNLSDATQWLMPRNHWIKRLPSAELVAMIVKEISPNGFTTSARSILPSTASYRLVCQLFADIKESAPTTRSVAANTGYTTISFPPAFTYLLSAETFVEEEDCSALLSSDIAFESRFYGRLIRSMINGFAGLEDIPASSILRFLSRQQGTHSLLVEFLRSSSSCTAKSLAESVFQIALEADDVNVARLLLDTQLVDANNTVCRHNGERLTPIENAALKQSLQIVRLLVDLGVDTNKSYSPKPGSYALHLLIRHFDYNRTLDQKLLCLFGDFMKTGPGISFDNIYDALRFVVDHRPASLLIESFTSGNLLRILSCRGLLKEIVRFSGEEYATQKVRLITQCLEASNDQCPDQFRAELGNTLEKAITRGYKVVVELLLPYGSLHKAFYNAIKSGHQGIIDTILEKQPDLETKVGESKLLAAALKYENQKLLLLLEERGVLDRVMNGNAFREALKCAIRGGNLIYATKLLDLNPNPHFGEPWLREVLVYAIAFGFDDIVWKLLTSAGNFSTVNEEPLYVATLQRKFDIVRALLEYGSALDMENPEILRAAIEHGDISLLRDIMYAHPYLYLSSDAALLAINKGGLDLFWTVLNLCRQDIRSLRSALNVAIWREDVSLLDEMFALGAIPNDETLAQAVKKSPSMTKALLKHFHKLSTLGSQWCTLAAVDSAICQHLTRPESLDMLLSFGPINVNSFLWGGQVAHTPLGKAITLQRDRKVAEMFDIQLIKKLLDAGGDADSITSVVEGQKQTALLDAIDTRSVDIVQLLLQHGACVNKLARLGIRRTPLQKAVEIRSLEIVRMLLKGGADVNAPPAMFHGGTALQLAAAGGNCTIATILIEDGARFDIPPPKGKFGRWPLEAAAENGRLDMIKLLWDANHGQFDDAQCQYAMRLAEYNGYMGCRDQIAELMAASTGDFSAWLSF